MGRGACAEAQGTAQATVQNNPQPLSKGITYRGQLIPCSNGIKSRKHISILPILGRIFQFTLDLFSKCFCIFQGQITY